MWLGLNYLFTSLSVFAFSEYSYLRVEVVEKGVVWRKGNETSLSLRLKVGVLQLTSARKRDECMVLRHADERFKRSGETTGNGLKMIM